MNRPGIYAFNVYVRGLPSIVTIDDNMPFLYLKEKYLYFAQPGWGGSLWAPLLEKSFAKVHGNYDNLNGGFPSEGFKYLTNAPTSTYDLAGESPISVNAFWEVIDDADSDKYMINIWTSGGPDGLGDQYEDPVYHLPYSHAYTIIKTKAVTATDGTVYKLLQVRNPWRIDYNFSGKWRDESDLWRLSSETFSA